MKRNLEIGELDRAILHHGLCLLGCEARKQEDKRLLERVEALRMLLYPEMEPQTAQTEDGGRKTEGQAEDPASRQTESQRTERGPAPQTQKTAPAAYTPTLPPMQAYQSQPAENAQTKTSSGGMHVISEKQSKRLYAIQMKSGKKQFEVKEYLKRMGFASSKDITVDKYEEIINWVQG